MRLLVTFVALIGTVQHAEGTCARVELAPKLLTPDGAAIPDDGGILVGWEGSTRSAPLPGDPSYRPEWKTSAPVVLDKLAPGLTLFRLKRPGPLTITDAKHTLGTFSRDASAGALALAAPKVKRAELAAVRFHYGEIGHTLALTLGDPVPADAVAVIVYVVRNKARVALSFGRVTPGDTSVVAFTDTYRCMFNPPTTQAPKRTERPVFVWVDRFGRRSKPSAPQRLAIVDNTKP